MRLGVLVERWGSQVRQALDGMPAVDLRSFDSPADLFETLRVESVDGLVVEGAHSRNTLRALAAHRSSTKIVPKSVLAILVDNGDVDAGLLLQAGVTEFICAPAGPNELALRLQRMLAPPSLTDRTGALQIADYTLDRREHAAQRGGAPISLTPREFELAWLLFSHAGQFVSHKQIAETVWGATVDIAERTLQTHMYNLRKKMQLAGRDDVQLRTVYAMGYRLEVRDSVGGGSAALKSAEGETAGQHRSVPPSHTPDGGRDVEGTPSACM